MYRPFCRRLFLLLLLIHSIAAYQTLSDDLLRKVPSGGDDYEIHSGALLSPILKERVPGTSSHASVQHHFVNFFRKALPKWTLEWQNSSSKTPLSGSADVPFANLIFRRHPPWTKPGQANYLTLVAHYDSKAIEAFIGATDSAVPCAILMHVARTVEPYLQQMHDEMVALGELGGTVAMDMGVQILFLDGEEAFVQWTDTDSLYGARSLAAAWETDFNPALSRYKTRMEQVQLFVLLDLLGGPAPTVSSYFRDTHWAYSGMAAIEERMRALGLLEAKSGKLFLPDRIKKAEDFAPQTGIEDDHIPFLARGAEVLHIIPSPFPDVWHKITDDDLHLDMKTVRDWSKIVTAFALEWLDIMELMP